MEQFALPILFAAIVATVWWTWSSGRKSARKAAEASAEAQDTSRQARL